MKNPCIDCTAKWPGDTGGAAGCRHKQTCYAYLKYNEWYYLTVFNKEDENERN